MVRKARGMLGKGRVQEIHVAENVCTKKAIKTEDRRLQTRRL